MGLTRSQITAAALPAHQAPWTRRLLADPELLADIAFALDGPFHLMYPPRVARNIKDFRAAFAQSGVRGTIYYGKKANKSATVMRVCAEHDVGADVASIGELTAALTQGVRGEELMVTGPEKSRDLLWLAARHQAILAIDSLSELDRLAELDIPARIVFRVTPRASDSRFGFTASEIARALAVCDRARNITLAGFSFHLSGYDPAPRAEFAAELVALCRHARTLGHPAHTLSIGGGFGVDYVAAADWSRFTQTEHRNWFHAEKGFSGYYPYHCPCSGAEMLTEILGQQDLARQLRDADIGLAIEPGRALLDQAGCTVFRVQGSKMRSAQGQPYCLLTVDGTSLSLSEQWFDSEFLPDPLLWPAKHGQCTPTAIGAATCLESDMLSWRRILLPRAGQVGDLVVYPNTAGYQMDSNESRFHQLPIPPKVVLVDTPEQRFRWRLENPE